MAPLSAGFELVSSSTSCLILRLLVVAAPPPLLAVLTDGGPDLTPLAPSVCAASLCLYSLSSSEAPLELSVIVLGGGEGRPLPPLLPAQMID